MSRDRGEVSKYQQKRHVGQGKLPGVSQKLCARNAIQIQRNSARNFLRFFFFDKRGIAKSVVNEHFNEKLFFQILDTECIAGKRVLTMCQYNFPHEKKNRRGGGSF